MKGEKRRSLGRRRSAGRSRSATPVRHVDLGSFPTRDRYTVTGHVVGDICFECECRVVQIGSEEGVTLAWCDCALPEEHHEMEIL